MKRKLPVCLTLLVLIAETSAPSLAAELGYAIRDIYYANENDPRATISVTRSGPYNFESTVQVLLRQETAIPGVDYINEVLTVTFAPGQYLGFAFVRLMNDTVEDGLKTLRVSLANRGDDVPITAQREGILQLFDNEQGYSISTFDERSREVLDGQFYEGAESFLTVYRLGDYDVTTTAAIEFRPSSWRQPPAIPGSDFLESTAHVEFAPGQKSARVALPYIDDLQTEPTKYLDVIYSALVHSSVLETNSIPIWDNELNPLLVEEICPIRPNSSTVGLFPIGNGQFIAPIFDQGFLAGPPVPNDTPDSTEIFRLPGSIRHVLPNGKLLVNTHPGLLLLNPNGSVDDSFAPYLDDVSATAVDAEARIYIAAPGMLKRLLPNGAPDPSFVSDQTGNSISSIFPADDGTIFIAGSLSAYPEHIRDFARLTASGAIHPDFDGAFMPIALTLRLHGERIYGISFENRTLQKLLLNGQLDPDFTPIPTPYGSPFAIDSQDRVVLVNLNEHPARVRRYLPNGQIDPAFLTGTIHFTAAPFVPFGQWMHLPNDNELVFIHRTNSLNGTQFRCANPFPEPVWEANGAIARVRLTTPQPRIAISPGQEPPLLVEEKGAQEFTFVRTGDNQSPLTVRFTARSATAQIGADLLPISGTLNFAPGVAHATATLTTIDDSSPLLPGYFKIDFSTETGTLLNTLDIHITHYDVAFQIARRETLPDGKWRIPIVNQISRFTYIRGTTNFEDYTISERAHGVETSLTIDPTRPYEFFLATPANY